MSRKRVELYEEVLPDGRCKYRLPYLDGGKNKTISVIMEKRSASNYKLALRTLQERLDSILTPEVYKNPSFALMAENYLEERAQIVKASTHKRNVGVINTLIRWIGDDVLVSDLSVPYVKGILKQNCPEAVTYNEYLKRLKALLNWGYMNDYMKDRSLIDKLQYMPDNKKERIEDKYLEKWELEKLLEEAHNRKWNLTIKFLALSGLRIGELIALEDSDIDQEYIHVNKTYETTVGVVDTPKTDTSTRDVYLRPELMETVKEIRSYMRVYQFEHGIRSTHFICSQGGSWLEYDAFRKYLRELSTKVLNRKITPHALRHTTVSLLIAEGVPLEVVSRMLGHKNSQITRDIYMHVTQELKHRDNNILKNASLL